MPIELAKVSGFCFGVQKALQTAYSLIAKDGVHEPIYMLGAIIHNEKVIEELRAKGVLLAHSLEDIEDNSTVIIRAHGISPDIQKKLEAKNCNIVDCTCPFVKRIHAIVEEAGKQGKTILVAGTEGHPEVLGFCGQTKGLFYVIDSVDKLKNIEFDPKSTILVSQTTFSAEEFKKIRQIVANKIANDQIFDTICSTTERRQREASELAARSDYMIVIGSSQSSNTMKLYDICKSRCAKTYLIGSAEDLESICSDPEFYSGNVRIGVTAGASTPDCIIREVIRTMSEKQATANQEQSDINFGDYIDNIPQLRKNATVRGAITSADNEYVYVDVHDKSEGRIPRHEFANDPDFDLEAAIESHEEIEVFVRSVRNSDMGKEILLSKAHVDFSKYKAQVEEAFENKIPVTVKVTNVVKDGVIATLGGVDIYIHRTQLDLVTVDDLDSYKGKTIEILVTQFDPDKRRLRVSGSRRALLNSLRKEKAEDVWNNIEVGGVYEGVVRSLTDFGAFVDIGGVDGLVHVSELSWNRIRHPSEVVSVGDVISVYVKDFDAERKRISLGYKRPEEDPYNNVEEKFPTGSVVRGIVVRMFQFGAFVELAPGVDALCHVSQISNVRLARPDEVLTEGMEVVARVLDVSNETRRISISIKDVEPIDPERSEEESDLEADVVVDKDVEAVAETDVVVTEVEAVEVESSEAEDAAVETTEEAEAATTEDAAVEATEEAEAATTEDAAVETTEEAEAATTEDAAVETTEESEAATTEDAAVETTEDADADVDVSAEEKE